MLCNVTYADDKAFAFTSALKTLQLSERLIHGVVAGTCTPGYDGTVTATCKSLCVTTCFTAQSYSYWFANNAWLQQNHNAYIYMPP